MLKLDGTKSTADTVDFEKNVRQAFCLGRSISEKIYGPSRKENPGESRYKAE